MPTQDEVLLERAKQLCDRGYHRYAPGTVASPRLEKILTEEDAFEARYVVPALVDMIERRGLK